jgi:hypothetical protein
MKKASISKKSLGKDRIKKRMNVESHNDFINDKITNEVSSTASTDVVINASIKENVISPTSMDNPRETKRRKMKKKSAYERLLQSFEKEKDPEKSNLEHVPEISVMNIEEDPGSQDFFSAEESKSLD